MRALLVIFVIAYGIVGLIGLGIAFVFWNYDFQSAAAFASIYAIFVGIPLGLGSILIFLGLQLKAQGDTVKGYGFVLGLGVLILAGLAGLYYLAAVVGFD